MQYTVFYSFEIGKSSFLGTENLCAKNADSAVQKVREKHPNCKLKIMQVIERNKKFGARKIKMELI